MTQKAVRISVGARTMLALFVLGLLLVTMSSGWELRQETRRRAERLDADLSAIPLLYAGPLAYITDRQPPEAVRGLLTHILHRHGLRSVELQTGDGEKFRAFGDEGAEPGPSAEFVVGQGGALRVQAAAPTLGNTLRSDPLLRGTLLNLALVTALSLCAALLLDRWLLRHLRRLSDEASRFDPTLPPQSLSWMALSEDERRPRELLQLEQAIAHVHATLGDELEREQSRGRQLREEVDRQHQALTRAERSLEASRRELAALERHDTLTGVANRREFEVALRREFKRAQRDQGRLALAVIDVDDLKPYNERHGREAGDAVLKRLARLLHDEFQRDTDVVARLGGEEFAVLLPGLDMTAAQELLERLREAWKRQAPPHGARPVSRAGADVVGLSLGLAAYQPGHPYLSAQALMQAADEALYLAKHTGRDRLCLAS